MVHEVCDDVAGLHRREVCEVRPEVCKRFAMLKSKEHQVVRDRKAGKADVEDVEEA